MKFKTALFSIVFFVFQTAHAGIITVDSYDMLNGSTGSYTYWDDSYSGSGSTTSGAALTGGAGDLTDGIIASGNWFNNPEDYVGWNNYNPLITFNFGSNVMIDSITVYVDDSNGYGGVYTPSSVDIGISGGSLFNHQTIDPITSTSLSYTFSNLGLTGNSIDIRFNRSGPWVFVSEVTFDGQEVQVPEPSTLAIFALGMIGLASRRFKKQS